MAGMYGGQTAEQRQAERRSRLLVAGRELVIGDRRYDIDIVTVCARAGLTRRYFYQEFGDLDSYLEVVFRSYAEEASAVIIAAAVQANGDLTERIAAGMEAAIGFVVDSFGGVGMVTEGLSAPAVFARHRSALTDVAYEKALELYQAVNDGETMPAELHGYTAFVVGGTAEALLRWMRGDLTLSRAEIVATCVDSLQRLRSALDEAYR